jgi:uncharacterized protein (TIGR03437 family)
MDLLSRSHHLPRIVALAMLSAAPARETLFAGTDSQGQTGTRPAAPTVASVVNAASNLPRSLPNGGIARGAIFVAYGSDLGPAVLAISPQPFQTTQISGVAATITVAGRTSNVPLYYVSATQVAGQVPSSIPAGTGTLTLTYNGQTSAAVPIRIVEHNFGIFTTNQRGSGEAIVTFADYSLVTATKAANPGDALILWGTGMGAVNGDETAGPLPGDMSAVPVKVWVGNTVAPVLYRGRTGCCIAEDQIVFTVPEGLTGCAIPLAVQIEDQVSNYATIALAPRGRTCPAGSLSPAIQPAPGQTEVSYGTISIVRAYGQVFGINLTAETGGAFFFREPVSTTATPIDPPLGACYVAPRGTASGTSPPPSRAVGLDAGDSLTVTGPKGMRAIAKSTIAGFYTSSLGQGDYLEPGTYTIANSGGPGVGRFTISVAVPSQFTWTNQSSATSINRANGFTLTWTGGDPRGIVQLAGSVIDTSVSPILTSAFGCYASAAAGSLTIPAPVLLSLPASENGNLSLTYTGSPVSFSATGIDGGYANHGVGVTLTVTFR